MAGEAQSLCTGACVDPEAHEGCVVSGLAMRTHVHMQRVERRSGPCGSTPSDSRCVWPIRNNSCSASSSRTQAALRNSSLILSVAKSWRFAVGRRAAARSSDLYRLIAGCAPPSPPPIGDAACVTWMAGFVLVFVGGISIPPDYARTRSQSRQVKRRVVIDQPSRTKYYTGCPVLHCGHVPYLEWLSTAPSKTNLVFAIRLAQQALPSRSARASPREVYAAPRRPQDPPLRPPQRC